MVIATGLPFLRGATRPRGQAARWEVERLDCTPSASWLPRLSTLGFLQIAEEGLRVIVTGDEELLICRWIGPWPQTEQKTILTEARRPLEEGIPR